MKVLLVAIFVGFCNSNPQLDLPPIPNVRPKLDIKSYSEGGNQSLVSAPDDRSTRYGPPYDDEDPEDRFSREKTLNRSTRYREGLDDRYDEYDRDYYNRNRERFEGRDYNGDRMRFGDDRYRNSDRDRYNDDRFRNNNDRYNDDQGRNNDDEINRNRFSSDRDQYNRDRQNADDRDQYNRDRDRYNSDRNRDRYNNNNNDERYNDRGRFDQRDPYYVSERERERGARPPYGPYSYNDRERYNDPNYYYNIENDPKYKAEIDNIRRLLEGIDRKSSLECSQNVAAQWNFETNVNEATHLDAVRWFSLIARKKYVGKAYI